MLGLGLGVPMPTGVGATMDGPFSPLDLSPVLWLDASDTSTITAADGAWLDGTGLQLPGLAGNYASTPDSAALSVTGDIDIKVKVALDDWTPSSIAFVATKSTTVGDQRSYYLTIHTTGTIRFYWSSDGVTVLNAQSTAGTGVADGATKWIRVTLDADNGSSQYVVKFYLSDDGTTWSQLGSTVTVAGTTSIYDSTAVLEFGSYNTGALGHTPMTVYRTIIQNAFDTADNTTNVVFDADFAAEAAGTLSFTEDSTNAATVTLTTTYGQVSQWDDKSLNGYNVTQATAAAQPTSGTRTINGHNVLDFSPDEWIKTSSAVTIAQPLNIIAVFELDVTTTGYLIDAFGLTNRNVLLLSAGPVYTANAGVNQTGGVPDTNVHVLRWESNAAASVVALDGSSIIVANTGSSDFDLITIGARYNGITGLDGAIAEIIVVDGTLTAGEIAATESYLADKWGITL